MRLTQQQIDVLKNTIHVLSPEAQLYLFGSRVDDTKRGGDIDLLVVSSTLTPKDLRALRIEFYNHFGEQKLDVVLDDGSFSNPFHEHILQKAILL